VGKDKRVQVRGILKAHMSKLGRGRPRGRTWVGGLWIQPGGEKLLATRRCFGETISRWQGKAATNLGGNGLLRGKKKGKAYHTKGGLNGAMAYRMEISQRTSLDGERCGFGKKWPVC